MTRLRSLFRRRPAPRPSDGWTCHVCGDYRPDALIGVASRKVLVDGDVLVTLNARYCLDRPSCDEGVAGALDRLEAPFGRRVKSA